MREDLWFLTRKPKPKLTVPSGLIIPLMEDDSPLPEGWERFTAPNNRFIKGGASAGDTGGVTYVGRSTDWAGAHTGPTVKMWISAIPGTVGDGRKNSNSGNHYHSFRVGYNPPTRHQILIKAKEDLELLPANAGVLSDVGIPHLTDVTPNGLLKCTDAISSSSTAKSVNFYNFSRTGSHGHVSGTGGVQNAGYAYSNGYSAGEHSHNASWGTVDDHLLKAYLGIWTDAVNDFDLVGGMYALWEGPTPPENWVICDGNNGTPNLIDRFISLDSGSLLGTMAGDGTITSRGGTTNNGAHNHLGTWGYRNSITDGFHGNQPDHSHSIGAYTTAFEPPFYTLIFIKYLGD